MASIVCLLMAVCPEIPSSVSDSSEASLLTELSVTRSERFMGAAGGTGAAELRLMSQNQEGEGVGGSNYTDSDLGCNLCHFQMVIDSSLN